MACDWDLVEEAKQWQPNAHPPLTKDMLLQQTFSNDSGWDVNVYHDGDGVAYGEELITESGADASSATVQAPGAEEGEQDSDSDSYN